MGTLSLTAAVATSIGTVTREGQVPSNRRIYLHKNANFGNSITWNGNPITHKKSKVFLSGKTQVTSLS
ncbi:hypothetical protein H5410_008517 [Solanum commersonii]|uniref:Uncharacterized protein n=1 Tax=Solanum commersonii TaxID=4109 RepID=A0A9J6AG03_SOLCO|nr:hypothetical protein H5410_008517 [Solanum commersonii]